MGERGNIGRNVERVRELHGESRRGLARRMFSNYAGIYRLEMQSELIDEDLLKAVASYYMISVEELTLEEIPGVRVEDFTPEMVFRRVDCYFPHLYSEKAALNRSFTEAFDIHERIYDVFRSGGCGDITEIPECLKLYEQAFTDERASLEAAVNHTALWYLHTLVTGYVSHILTAKPSSFISKYTDKKSHRVSERDLSDMEWAAEKLMEEHEKVSFEREFRRLFIYIGVMMNTDGGTQIADFYMASGNIYNIITHGMSRELNRTFGILFMQSLYLAGNKYATRLLVT